MGRSFDGSAGNYWENAGFQPSSAATIHAWVRPNGDFFGAITAAWTDFDKAWAFMLSSRTIYAAWNYTNLSWDTCTGSTVLSTSAWTSVCAVKTGSTGAGQLEVFVNGVSDGTATATSTVIASSGESTRIGSSERTGSGSDPFDGDIAEISYWDIALPDEVIAALATGVSGNRIGRLTASTFRHIPFLGSFSPEPEIGASGSLAAHGNVSLTGSSPATTTHPPVGSPYPDYLGV